MNADGIKVSRNNEEKATGIVRRSWSLWSDYYKDGEMSSEEIIQQLTSEIVDFGLNFAKNQENLDSDKTEGIAASDGLPCPPYCPEES